MLNENSEKEEFELPTEENTKPLAEPMVEDDGVNSPLLATDGIEEQEYTVAPPLADEQEGAADGAGEAENYNPIAANTEPFAALIADTYAELVPGILTGIMTIGEYRLVGLPNDVVRFFKSGNKEIEDAFAINKEYRKNLETALNSYLKTAGTKPPSPLAQVIIAALAPVVSGGLVAMKHRKAMDIYLVEIQNTIRNGQTGA